MKVKVRPSKGAIVFYVRAEDIYQALELVELAHDAVPSGWVLRQALIELRRTPPSHGRGRSVTFWLRPISDKLSVRSRSLTDWAEWAAKALEESDLVDRSAQTASPASDRA